MSIASYAELQTAVAGWLNRGDLTAKIPDFILLGEKRIQREVRSPDMETAFSGAIASGVLAVPTDFLGWKLVYVNAARIGVLQVKPLDALFQQYPARAADSQPKFIARDGANFQFGPFPDSNYTIKGTYYKRLTTVSSSWNALATANPDLYLMATLCEAAPYIKDDGRVALWEGKYGAIVEAINAEAKEMEHSFGALRMAAR